VNRYGDGGPVTPAGLVVMATVDKELLTPPVSPGAVVSRAGAGVAGGGTSATPDWLPPVVPGVTVVNWTAGTVTVVESVTGLNEDGIVMPMLEPSVYVHGTLTVVSTVMVV